MKRGEVFNISKVSRPVRLPLEMLNDRRVSFTAKILYGLMVSYAGSVGYFSLPQKRFAEDLGVSIDMIRNAVHALKRKKYILVKAGGHGHPSIYYFLWRDEFMPLSGSGLEINLDPEFHKRIIKHSRKHPGSIVPFVDWKEERKGNKSG